MPNSKNIKDECVLCSNPKLPTGDYCEWCQNKIDTYEPDDKIEEENKDDDKKEE